MYSEKILHKLGVESLSNMQEEVIDLMLHTDKDLAVLSPTGSGKTLAYLLPLVNMVDGSADSLQAVVIVPSRELALQSDTVCRSMSCGVRSMSLYGGRTAMDEHRMIDKLHPQIVFTTPGRFIDHVNKHNINTDDVKWLIIDEFDKCLRMGFHREMSETLGLLPSVERRILVSATDADDIPSFVRMGRVARINYLPVDELIPERVSLYYVRSTEKDKLESLLHLLCSYGEAQTIVFLNYRDSVKRVSDFLRERGLEVSEFHGGMEQGEREEAIYRFSNGSTNVLVSTDLASRGLDMPDVDNVIHYHLPVGEEEYVHRVGRTGRWQSNGKAFFLLGPNEDIPAFLRINPEEYRLPETELPLPMPRMVTLYIGKGKLNKISKGDIVGFLCKTCGMNGSDIGRIDVYERYTYVAVRRDCWRNIVKLASGQKLKGIRAKVEKAF